MGSGVNDADEKGRPRSSGPPAAVRAQREARLAKALRDNLRRRKGAGQDVGQDGPDRPSED